MTQITGKIPSQFSVATIEALRTKLNMTGQVAGTFSTVLPTTSIATDKVYMYSGVNGTLIGGITWYNGDSAIYNGSVWTRIPLDTAINYFRIIGRNIFDKAKITRGFYLSSDGTATADANSAISEWFEIELNSSYHFSGFTSTNALLFLCFYDENKVFTYQYPGNISQLAAGMKVTPPASASFFRFTVYILSPALTDSVRLDNVMVQKYVPTTTTYPGSFIAYTETLKPLTSNIIPVVCRQTIIKMGNHSPYWSTKKIRILGTSITEANSYNGIDQNPWFINAMNILGVTSYVNHAQSGSFTDFVNGSRIGLSATHAEKIANSGTMPCYEDLIIPNINETDLFLFETAVNTPPANMGLSDINYVDTTHRGTYIGAMNYIINEMKKLNPTVQIGLISHWNKITEPRYVEAQKLLAARWNIPILLLCDLLGGTTDMVSGSFTINGTVVTDNRSVLAWYSTDGLNHYGDLLHPYNPKIVSLYTRLVAEWIKNNF